MDSQKKTTEKILAEALELREKGVSLNSIIRTYPEHENELSEVFIALDTLRSKVDTIAVPEESFARLLAALPIEQTTVKKSVVNRIESPFTNFWANLQFTKLKFVLPIAALALLTGGLVINTNDGTAVPVVPIGSNETTNGPAATLKTNPRVTAVVPPEKTTKTTETKSVATLSATMSSALMTGTKTDQVLAMLTNDASNESTIAKESSTENTVFKSNKRLAADPTLSYEN